MEKDKSKFLKNKSITSKKAAEMMETTPVKKRLSDAQFTMVMDKAGIEDAIFQHSIFCHTFFPYRNLKEVTSWKQEQGDIKLAVQSLETLNRETGKFENVGIPYGTKSRLILMHLNTNAIQTQNPVIDVGATMSQYIKELGLSVQVNSIREVKEQLKRIQASNISLAYCDADYSLEIRLQIIKKVENWLTKDERQRVFWDSSIELSKDYFESLMKHAIPLDKRAIGALSHNAMALDIYAWLAQRLHRINPAKPQFVSWKNLKDQFGQGYGRMDNFKQAFRQSLLLAKVEYMAAKFDEDKNKGFYLYNSPSPIPQKIFSLNPAGVLV